VFIEHKTENGAIKLKLKCIKSKRKGENSTYQLISELTFVILYYISFHFIAIRSHKNFTVIKFFMILKGLEHFNKIFK
jgi:hypothetical protein